MKLWKQQEVAKKELKLKRSRKTHKCSIWGLSVKQALQTNDNNTTRSKKGNADSKKIFFNLNYLGETAGRMIKICTKKLYKTFRREINDKFITHYQT